MIPTIQMRSDDGSSSSSSNFIRTRISRTDVENIAILSEMTMSVRIPKIVIETGFCVMSETEFKMTLVIEENIVRPVYRVVERDARMGRRHQTNRLTDIR